MLPFAATLQLDTHTAVLVGLGTLFWFFVLASFLSVARYGMRAISTGQLLDNERSPRRFTLPGIAGWFFTIGVLELIFLQSVYYVVLVCVGIAGILIESNRTAEEQFGFARLRPAQLMVWSLLGFGAIMVVEAPLMAGVSWLMDQLHLPHPEQESVEAFKQFNKFSAIAGFIFQAVILFPVIEELFFRGFLLTFLKNYTSTWMALVLSAGVFAFAHVNVGAAIPLWFLGIALGIAYEHTGSLLLPIGIHACWNLVTALSLLLDKGT